MSAALCSLKKPRVGAALDPAHSQRESLVRASGPARLRGNAASG